MAVVTQTVADVLNIARNVTGRVDPNDPAFTNEIMMSYLTNFIQVEHPQEVRLFQNRTWWRFNIDTTSPDPYPVDLDNLMFSTIGPPAYVEGFDLFWYQDPTSFFEIWPETQTYAPSRPTYVLYYNNELIFRNPPNREYEVKIATYKIDIDLTALGDPISNAYLLRYLAYGMSLDIFSDYGEMDKYNEIFPVYRRYKAQVLARTHQQMMNQRTTPTF